MGGPSFGFGLSGGGSALGNFITIGPAPSASAGAIRLANNTFITERNAGNTADITLIGATAAGTITIGENTATANILSTVGFGGTHVWTINTSNVLSLYAAAARFAVPLAGDQFNSLAFNALSSSFAIAGSAVTLTAAQYECPFLVASGTPGADRTVIAPNNGVWLFYNTSNNAQTFKTAAGTGISVATVKGAWLKADGTNVVRLSNDF